MEHFDSDGPLAPVDPADVQAVWRFMQRANSALGEPFDEARNAESGAPALGVDISLLAGNCSEGADVIAVSFRSMLISILLHMGLLSPWQQNSELNSAVFQVAATIPIASINEFDSDEFLTMLRDIADLR